MHSEDRMDETRIRSMYPQANTLQGPALTKAGLLLLHTQFHRASRFDFFPKEHLDAIPSLQQ